MDRAQEYLGRGMRFLLTFGLFGIGWQWDSTVILCSRFKDGDGRFIMR